MKKKVCGGWNYEKINITTARDRVLNLNSSSTDNEVIKTGTALRNAHLLQQRQWGKLPRPSQAKLQKESIPNRPAASLQVKLASAVLSLESLAPPHPSWEVSLEVWLPAWKTGETKA